MKKLLVLVIMLCASAQVFAVTAHFTGQWDFVTTVTYKQAIKCEYQAYGNHFWRIFAANICPQTVEVQ